VQKSNEEAKVHLKTKTQKGSISTITQEISKVGKSKILKRSKPIHELGPQWNGVKGVLFTLHRFSDRFGISSPTPINLTSSIVVSLFFKKSLTVL